MQKDSVHYYQRGANGLIIVPYEESIPFSRNVTFADTMFFEPAFLPVVYDGKLLPDGLDFRTKPSIGIRYNLIDKDSTFIPLMKRDKLIKQLRRNFATIYPDQVHYAAEQFDDALPGKTEEKVINKNIFQQLISVEGPNEITAPKEFDKYVPKTVYWIKKGEHTLQIAQNYISDNWRGGGNSSFYIRSYHKFNLDYKKDKVTFNNMLEWKLNLQQMPADELHDFNVSEDLLRMENKIGYKAFDNWSYSGILETKLNLFNSYPVNSNEKKAAFASPLYVNFGVGMDYSLEKKTKNDKNRKYKLSTVAAPLSLNFKYVGDNQVKVTNYGIEEGKKSKLEFGYKINADFTLNFNRYMTWTSRFYTFSNYHRIEAEFENKFDMALNRFLSTSINIFFRFDDTGAVDPGWGFFQRNELISFGLNYKW
jgi:hypothetical protein